MDLTFYRFLWLINAVKTWLTRRFTTFGLGVLACLVVSAIIGMDTNQSLSYQIFTFLLALLTIAMVASLFSKFRFSATRILPRFGTVGMPLKYRVVLNNQTIKTQHSLQLLEILTDSFPHFRDYKRIAHLPKNGYARVKQWKKLMAQRQWAIAPALDLPPLSAEGETEVVGEMMPLRRGMLRFKAISIACPDPLGLFNRCFSRSLPQSILILPKRYQIPPIQLPGTRRHQSGGVALASSVGDSEEFRSLREYRPGDPPRKIHWKSWAKVGKPIVKEEQDEYFIRHALILDTFQTESHSEILEEAVSVAASLACEIQTQDSLLDMIFVGLEAHGITIGRGLGQKERMLELLATVTPCQDKLFESIIPIVQNKLADLSGCICILLTWDDARKALVELLQQYDIPLLVLVIGDHRSIPDSSELNSLIGSQSYIHALQLGQIQQGLLQL